MSRAPGQPFDRENRSSGPCDTSNVVTVEELQRLWLLRSVSRTILAPMDRVKFVMQCQRELQRLGTLPGDFRNTWACVRHLYQMEGPRSFWRGNLIQVVALLPIMLSHLLIAIPTQTFIFEMWPAQGRLGYTCASFAALIGGATASSMLSYPLEHARFRLAVDVKPYRGAPYRLRHSLAFFSQPVLNDSPHLLYKGLMLYMFGSLVYRAMYSMLTDMLSPYIPPELEDSNWRPVVVQTVCGMSIAATSTILLHPVDLVRHRLMVTVAEENLRYPSAMHCVGRILQHEGIRGFYRGVGITLARMVVASSLLIFELRY